MSSHEIMLNGAGKKKKKVFRQILNNGKELEEDL